MAIEKKNPGAFLELPAKLHCPRRSFYVNFLGGLGSNEFHINEGLAHDNWKNQNPGAVLELPAKQHCQFGPFTKKATSILIFSAAMGVKPSFYMKFIAA